MGGVEMWWWWGWNVGRQRGLGRSLWAARARSEEAGEVSKARGTEKGVERGREEGRDDSPSSNCISSV